MKTKIDLDELRERALRNTSAAKVLIDHAELVMSKARGDRKHYASLYAALARLKVLDRLSPRQWDELALSVWRAYTQNKQAVK